LRIVLCLLQFIADQNRDASEPKLIRIDFGFNAHCGFAESVF
jgi:hypothetical protein